MLRLLEYLRGLVGNAGNLWAVIGLAREFIDLIKQGKYEEAEQKAIDVLKLFVPPEFAGAVDAFLDALLDTVLAGIVLYGEVLKLIGTKAAEGEIKITVGAALGADTSGIEACLATMQRGTVTSGPADPGKKTENPIVIIAVIGLIIQLADFIIKRRRERRGQK